MSEEPKPAGERRWRGKTADERRQERLELLFEAGVELFGTNGYANTSVKAVCDEAGLTERYFYEAFDDREDLLSRIYETLIDDAANATLKAISEADNDLNSRVSAGLRAFATQVTEDPRKARIQEIEVVGVSEEFEIKRRGAIQDFAGLIASVAREYGGVEGDGPMRFDVIALGLVGAVNETLIEFVLGDLNVTLDELIANQVGMFEALAESLIGS